MKSHAKLILAGTAVGLGAVGIIAGSALATGFLSGEPVKSFV